MTSLGQDLLEKALDADRRKNPDEALALCNQLLAEECRSIPALLLRGKLLLSRKEYEDAAGAYEAALSYHRNSVEASMGLGLSLFNLDRVSQALGYLEKAVNGGIRDAEVYSAMATCYQRTGRTTTATRALRRAVALRPRDLSLLIRFARALIREEQREEALQILHSALEVVPDSPDANNAMALLLPQLGRFEEAKVFARKALSVEPGNPSHYIRLVYAAPFEESDWPLLDRLKSLTKQVPVREKIGIEYALGKAFEDLDRFDEAGPHFLSANRLSLDDRKKKGDAYDTEAHRREVDFIIETFPAGADFGIVPNPSDLPVFVIGMMRSGTTLAEQILSSHRDIGAGGEQVFWRDHGPQLHEGLVRRKDSANLKAAADHYLSLLGPVVPEKLRVCDKLPQNYMMVGLIRSVFPNARFIHCQRDSRDTCLSLFTTPFTFPPPFANDAESIAFAYRQYLRLMDHWKVTVPQDRLLTVRYEDLVQDREIVSKQMIEFVGLPWDSNCLFPEKNRRGLSNPSQWQARQPVYASSIGRWKRFIPSLQAQIDHWDIVER